MQRDKASLDIFWLRDESFEDAANLSDPDVIAAEIIEDLRAALEEFEATQLDLSDGDDDPGDLDQFAANVLPLGVPAGAAND